MSNADPTAGANDATIDDDSTSPNAPQDSPGRVLSPLTAGVLTIISLGWLSLYIVSLYNMLGAELSVNQGAIVLLALSLSGFFLGGTYAGAVMGLIWAEWQTHSSGPVSYIPRWLMAMLGALIVAMITCVTVFLLFLGNPGAAGLLSGGLAISILLGGTLGIFRRRTAIAAGLVAFIALLMLMILRGYAMDPIFTLFEQFVEVDRVLGYQMSQMPLNLIGGIACGIVAFAFLRLTRLKANLWTYMVAGAIPGLIWLGAEILNRVVGSMLLNMVTNLHVLDVANRQMALEAQFNGALTVLFAGATTAVLAFGLLLSHDEDKPTEDEADDETSSKNPADDDSLASATDAEEPASPPKE
ncbi:hypothetical protein [Natronoglycomyces albus]|uniref:Uncharacterized protein n=1 Tax=Natronoglycomyces albus TaxID=2811108 RepID=A0A895XID3_9ACTN|nr:hypothetical protein [Natronoglycomyces albus]QSB04717.1 hypothetical protein JQS30_13200 [Natronoglycomyces albus]